MSRWSTTAGIGVIALVSEVWSRSEVAHTHSLVSRSVAAAVPVAATSPTLQLAWRSSDATAIGSPLDGGTVVTFSRHTVTGRGALTGQSLWSFTRTDSDVCQVAVEQGKAVAVYARDGNCDEVDALDAGTGALAWTRTLDENGTAIDGIPTVVAASDTLFLTTPMAIFAIALSARACNPSTGADCGLDYWTYAPPAGCLIRSVVPGSGGVLISQHCPDGNELLLRDRYLGADDKNTRIAWTITTPAVPVAADDALVAVEPSTATLLTYQPATGRVISRRALTPAPGLDPTSGPLATVDAQTICLGETCYHLDDAAITAWAGRYPNPPVLDPTDNSIVYAATTRSVTALAARDGTSLRDYSVDVSPAPRLVVRLDTGFLLGGTHTTVYV